MKYASLIERFEEKYVINLVTGCYEWIGGLQTRGYGSFGVGDGTTALAHRWALENIAGVKIPKGLKGDHVCNNRACVNVVVPHAEFLKANPGAILYGHLRIVTTKVNNLAPHSNCPAGVNARRTHCVHGHELSGENLRVRADGRRRCVQCALDESHRARDLARGGPPRKWERRP